ncbi:MAG: agmatine deiminase family protein [Planctomycetes bacterium]|nr:agmatine deiminase family protein [Planctomycetota bacterium]
MMQPAEWTRHDAVWLAWPSHEDLWLEQLVPVQNAFVAFCEAIVARAATNNEPAERLEILCPQRRHAEAHKRLGHLSPRFHEVPFGDIWLRDTAPIFVHDATGAVCAASFRFNGWGGKYELDGDGDLSQALAVVSGLPTQRHSFVLEGGAIETDGQGTVLTTEQCLLNPNRNPGMTRSDVEQRLHSALGARKVLWLRRGLQNDHTDGHVDTLVRFIAPGRVLAMEPNGRNDPNAEALLEVLDDLSRMRAADGEELEIISIPSPGVVHDSEGRLMAASYVNFYISNRGVAVPTYGVPADQDAVDAIASLFPGRLTVGVRARELLAGGGAFHCISQQQPAARSRA